jgi:hypothetical protein
VDAYFDVFAEDGDVLAKIEPVAEFRDGGVTLDDLGDGRGRQEPRGEGVFAHSRAGEGEEFEEAASPEEIQVGGVEAGMNINALSGLASANPAVFDAGEAVAIELDGAFCAGTLAQHLCMKDGNYEKQWKSD